MCIATICSQVCDVINLKVTITFSSPKSQDKKVNISRTKRAFNMKYKTFLIIFKGLSVVRNCLRLESGLLNR